jgi:hypothetical protein
MRHLYVVVNQLFGGYRLEILNFRHGRASLVNSVIKSQQIAETPNGSLNGTIASELNRSNNGSSNHAPINGTSTIGLNGGITSDGGVWSTHQEPAVNPNTPGFEEDLKNNRKYSRFNS